MKKLHFKLLVSISVLLFFVLTIFNVFSISKSFDRNQMLEDFREIKLISSDSNKINIDFLLNYNKVVVIAIYEDGNRGVYDPENVLDRFTILSDKGRYFNYDDYVSKKDVKIKVVANEAENKEDNTFIATARLYSSMDLTSYYMFNLFSKQSNIKQIVIFGEQQNQVISNFQKLGFKIQDPPYFSIQSLLDLSQNTNQIITMVMIFFYSCIVFTLMDIIIQFIKFRKTIRIHYLNGLSLNDFMIKYVLRFILKLAFLMMFLAFAYKHLIWIYRINNQLLFEILMVIFVGISIVYSITAFITFKRVEVKYDVY